MTVPARQPQGIPAGGQFAPDTHAEPALALGASANRFADVDNIRDLDHAATAALQSLAVDGDDEAAADEVRAEWLQRRDAILTVRRRQDFTEYARRREEEASALLSAAARANLRNIADELSAEHPQAAKITLARDYDDGNLAVYVESVHDEKGTALPDEVVDAAQELVSEHSSRQLARFVDESPIDLAAAAAWNPPGRPGALFG
jgi:3-dehydroquinate dehydratase